LQLSYGCSRARIRQLHSAGAQCQQLPAASRHGRVNGCVASVPTRGRGTSTVDDAVCRSTSALPAETVTADIHCVTRWSKLDTVRGVPVDMLLDQVQHDAVMSAGLDISDIQNGRWLLPCRAREAQSTACIPGVTVPWPDQRSHRPFCTDSDGTAACPHLLSRLSGAGF
jgi:hypothetical protein